MFQFQHTQGKSRHLKKLSWACVQELTDEELHLTSARKQEIRLLASAPKLTPLNLQQGDAVIVYYLAPPIAHDPGLILQLYPTSLTAAQFTQIYITNTTKLGELGK